jgi:N-methylhydantoinase B
MTTMAEKGPFDPVLLAVLANRFDSIVREMTNTLFRTGRSAVLNTAKDFSCSIVTSGNELLASVEGLQVHVFGAGLQCRSMTDIHGDDLAEGDAFLHNDPYLGNTHTADHTILVPVFVGGEHLFTVCAKAHQADCGNSLPSTYMPFSRDLYEEGGLNFPCVRIQRDYEDVGDVIRM